MNSFNADSFIQKKIKELSSSIKNNIIYDAKVEGIDLSEINVSFEKINEENYKVVIGFDNLNDYYKQLAKDIYLKNGMKRRKW